ncbi:MAG: hypothetical protein Tsb0013_11730 [Phycisphaerales bacterium]
MDPSESPRWSQRIDPMVIKLICAIESASLITVVAVMYATGAPPATTAIAVGLLILPIVVIARSTLRIRLEPLRLRWTFYPFWRGSLAYDDIESVEVERVDAMRDYMGWGPKVSRTAFGAIARSGPAVRIGRRSKRRDLVLTCDEAEELADALRTVAPNLPVEQPAS